MKSLHLHQPPVINGVNLCHSWIAENQWKLPLGCTLDTFTLNALSDLRKPIKTEFLLCVHRGNSSRVDCGATADTPTTLGRSCSGRVFGSRPRPSCRGLSTWVWRLHCSCGFYYVTSVASPSWRSRRWRNGDPRQPSSPTLKTLLFSGRGRSFDTVTFAVYINSANCTLINQCLKDIPSSMQH